MLDEWLQFGTPSALGALAALILLLLVSLWRPRPARVVVPSVALWKRVSRRSPPIRAARRPRISLILLLQILAIASMVGGMADPSVRGRARPSRNIVVVVDTSGRMLAHRADGRTRFDAARASLAGAVRADDRIELFWMEETVRRWEGSGRELASKLDEIRPIHARADWTLPVDIVRHREAEVWFLSDRPWIGSKPPGGLVEFLGGEPADNSGIAFVSLEGDELFVRFVRHGAPRDAAIVVTADGRELLREDLRLEPGTRSWWRRISPGESRSVAVSIAPSDQLNLDDRAVLTRFHSNDEVRLEGPEHPALARALQAVPGIRLGRGSTAVLYRTLEGRGEATVYVDPPEAPPGFESGVRWVPREWSVADHVLTRDVQRGDLASAGAREVRGGDPILWADGRCVAAVRGQTLVLGFELSPGGWIVTPSFPIFWTNVIDFVRTGGTWRVLRTGRPAGLPSGVLEVTARDSRARFHFDAGGRELLALTTGAYRAKTSSGIVELEASLLDARESDTSGLWSAGEGASVTAAAVPRRTPIGAPVCVAALLLALLSWLLDPRSR